MTDSNPRATIGNNSGADATDEIEQLDEATLEKVVRVCKAEYNKGAQAKRHANEKLRDLKGDFKTAQAPVYAEIDAIMSSARERLKSKLETVPGYTQAEEDKRDASLTMKAALKKLKDSGVDVQAFKIANKMADMDPEERKEFFDAIDMQCKVMRLW